MKDENKELEDWCRSLKDEFISNRSRSRSRDKSYSPIGSNSRSRLFSPNTASPGNITPKEKQSKTRTKHRDNSQRKTTKITSENEKGSKAFASLIRDPHYAPQNIESPDIMEISDDQLRQPDFESQEDIQLFSSSGKVQKSNEHPSSIRPTDLSRTTFGMKAERSAIDRQETVNISREEYENLKIILSRMIEGKDREIKVRLNEITDDLNKKTLALNKMKRTLVAKLKELETSLIETNKEYQMSLEAEQLHESSQEERGESQMAELIEQKKKLEKDLEHNIELLNSKIRETQDQSLELKKYKRDMETARKTVEETIAKQKA